MTKINEKGVIELLSSAMESIAGGKELGDVLEATGLELGLSKEEVEKAKIAAVGWVENARKEEDKE